MHNCCYKNSSGILLKTFNFLRRRCKHTLLISQSEDSDGLNKGEEEEEEEEEEKEEKLSTDQIKFDVRANEETTNTYAEVRIAHLFC